MSETVLDAPCVFCGYNSYNYWQRGTHAPDCPWREVGGDADRIAAVRGVVARLASRVAELEGENAKLRACIQPGGMLTCPFCLGGGQAMTAKRRPLPIKKVARQAWVNDGRPDTVSDNCAPALGVYEDWTETILTALRDAGYDVVKVPK